MLETNKKRVVVTGLGVVSPIGNNITDFKNSLINLNSGIIHIPEMANYGFGCQVAGIPDVKQSPCYQYIEKYHLSDSAKIIQYAVTAALEAWLDAGFEIPTPNQGETNYDIGCIIGSGIGSPDIFSEKIIPYTQAKRIKHLRSSIVEKSMLSGASANLGWILALGNQLSFNSSACSTGLESIILAFERIQSGKAKCMVAGSAEADYIYTWACFDAMQVLNRKKNDKPDEASCPMSAEAAGFVPGAGAGALILEEYEHAVSRGAKIYAEIISANINSGGQRNSGTMTIPNPEGVIRCITQTVEEAQINSSEIDYINGHLSSTIADIIEIKNWVNALNRYGNDFPIINSLKSLTGHCIG
ncbi:MAG: beta-ketoacyl-[acyl-carrier-protein] synthase family protein, partial [Bacteroidales bacterium]|nr:beta-ketoacyl-[acyl-carrier-protein] synthase family protein [Bacteroidales bacterium]